MRSIVLKLSFITLLALVISSCHQENKPADQKSKWVIAVSKASPVENYTGYINWLKDADSTVTWVDMYQSGIDRALEKLDSCDGLLLTGGEDIFPGMYGLSYDSTLCDAPNFYRDSLEMNLLQEALSKGIPVMGICRGMQMINVVAGGTLYFDLPAQKDTTVKHRNPGYKPVYHRITISDGSLLSSITDTMEGSVYSNHHQGVRDLAHGLRAIAFSDDHLVEAVQLADTVGNPFLLGVQWHPEKMDYKNPFSGRIARLFIEHVKSYHEKKGK